MKKIIWISLLLAVTVFFTGCGISENGSQGNNTESHTESLTEDTGNENASGIANDYEVHEAEYVFDEGGESEYKVTYAQISGINDKDIEADINQALKLAVTEWLKEDTTWMEKCEYVVTCHTQRYLSLLYTHKSIGGNPKSQRTYITRFGITVDMQTGKRVFLDELMDAVSLKEKLMEYEYSNDIGAPITAKDANKIIQGASLSEMEYFVLEYHNDPLFLIGSSLHYKPSFYFTDNQIVILRNIDMISDYGNEIFLDFEM